MPYTIMLYGATGYSGRLIAKEGRRRGMSDADPTGNYRMLLAGRDGESVSRLAADNAMPFRTFGLDDPSQITRQLQGIDVLVNAAGPFAWTADRLAKAALAAGCHYVDINGEVDVYLRLDDLGPRAVRRKRVLVCGAGHSAAASDILLDCALRELESRRNTPGGELGTIRIALARVATISRGSAQTAWRSLREQVTVARARPRRGAAPAAPRLQSVLWHEPVGKRERAFDFRGAPSPGTRRETKLAVAAAANLVDTLAARLTVRRRGYWAHRIESYVQVGTLERITYPIGALLAPLTAFPAATALMNAQLRLLPEGPSGSELTRDHSLVLEIEDCFRTRIIDWRWKTPNVYLFTAQLAVEVAIKVTECTEFGWRTPADVLGDRREELRASATDGALRGCKLDERSV